MNDNIVPGLLVLVILLGIVSCLRTCEREIYVECLRQSYSNDVAKCDPVKP